MSRTSNDPNDACGEDEAMVLYVDFKLDESYTAIRPEIKSVELVKPSGWVYVSLSGTDSRDTFFNTFMLQISILSNHLNGRDTHIRQIKVYGPRPNTILRQPSLYFSGVSHLSHAEMRKFDCERLH
ncbi:hypothetical protein Bca101_058083 [Brassica carinata]